MTNETTGGSMENDHMEALSIAVDEGPSFMASPLVRQATNDQPEPSKIFWPDGTEATAGEFRDAATAASTGWAKGRRAGLAEARAPLARLRRLVEECRGSWDRNGDAPDMQEYQDMLHLLGGIEVPRRWWDA